MKSCWQQDPKKRSTFSEISKLMDKYLEELAGYMNVGCLFPEIQQQKEIAKRLSNSALVDARHDVVKTPPKDFAATICVTSPQGSETFL